jgi:hypothetical protein
MEEAEDELNERLDQPEMVTRGCQAIRLVEWLNGQEQGHWKPGEQRKRHRSDTTPWLGGEPQAMGVRAAMRRQDTRPIGGFNQDGVVSSPDGSTSVSMLPLHLLIGRLFVSEQYALLSGQPVVR